MPKQEVSPDENSEEKLEEKSNITETNDGGVEVSVEEETPQEIPAPVVKQEEKKSVRQDPITNKVYAHDRILSSVQKSIEELKNIMLQNSSQMTNQQEQKLDEIDKLAQTDWKAAVSKISETTAREILDNDRKQIETQREKTETSQVMERNASLVVTKHNELNDPDSEKSKIFQDILDNNPRWRTSPDGPLLTMYSMEDELRKRGYVIDSPVIKKTTERTITTSLPSSRPTATGNKIVLTREQREFCEQNGLSYEDYARTLRKSGEGIAI